jgi:hypothetical protein
MRSPSRSSILLGIEKLDGHHFVRLHLTQIVELRIWLVLHLPQSVLSSILMCELDLSQKCIWNSLLVAHCQRVACDSAQRSPNAEHRPAMLLQLIPALNGHAAAVCFCCVKTLPGTSITIVDVDVTGWGSSDGLDFARVAGVCDTLHIADGMRAACTSTADSSVRGEVNSTTNAIVDLHAHCKAFDLSVILLLERVVVIEVLYLRGRFMELKALLVEREVRFMTACVDDVDLSLIVLLVERIG